MNEFLHDPSGREPDPDFPDAPADWTRSDAESAAESEGIELTEDHWNVIRGLQQYFVRTDRIRVREIHDALDEYLHSQGGIRFAYTLFPGGPIAQGCRLAGLHPPPGAVDKSFGSVQ